jgi:arsenate reductase-like glutaredoxin family protein
MIVHGIASCDATRAALKALAAAGNAPVFRDLRESPPGVEEIAGWLERLGPDLLNRRSATWRGLSRAERAQPAALLLGCRPLLIKRPLIEDGVRMSVGWGPESRNFWLGAEA